MSRSKVLLGGLLALAACLASAGAAQAKTLRFAGYDWVVKSGDDLGPGPCNWSAANAWVAAEEAHAAALHETKKELLLVDRVLSPNGRGEILPRKAS